MATSFNGGSEIQENENKEIIGVSKEGAMETIVNMGLVNRQQYGGKEPPM